MAMRRDRIWDFWSLGTLYPAQGQGRHVVSASARRFLMTKRLPFYYAHNSQRFASRFYSATLVRFATAFADSVIRSSNRLDTMSGLSGQFSLIYRVTLFIRSALQFNFAKDIRQSEGMTACGMDPGRFEWQRFLSIAESCFFNASWPFEYDLFSTLLNLRKFTDVWNIQL